jgi:hypothetical protein
MIRDPLGGAENRLIAPFIKKRGLHSTGEAVFVRATRREPDGMALQCRGGAASLRPSREQSEPGTYQPPREFRSASSRWGPSASSLDITMRRTLGDCIHVGVDNQPGGHLEWSEAV